jgi:precorrin-4 methylase
MHAELYGIEHFTYIGITSALAAAGLILAKKYAKTEISQSIVLKSLSLLLFAAIMTNRISQVFRYETTHRGQVPVKRFVWDLK